MKRRFTEDSWRREPWFRSLVAGFASLRTEDDIANFLRDVATLSELQAFSERFEVARLLAQGHSYRAVAAQTGASTTTVTRVAHFLENGEGGYRKILKVHRHHHVRKGQQASRASQPLEGAPVIGQAQQPQQISALQKYLKRQSE